jgi:ribonuclease BN (tRNA processing enzyme)
MRVLILGVGDAFTRLHFGSSALVHAPDGFLLIDCPDPIHRVLREATERAGWSADAHAIDDIVITHLHGDHCNGLESFGFLRRIARVRNPNTIRPRVHVTRLVADRLWERLGPAMHAPFGGAADQRPSTLEDYFDVRMIEPQRPALIAGLTLRCRFTKHPVPTVGLLLESGSRVFGWSGDTPFEPAHIEWLNQAQMFVHESIVGAAHTPMESLNGQQPEVRSKIRLIHLPDDFDETTTDIKMVRAGEVLSV